MVEREEIERRAEEIAQWLDYGYRNSEAGVPAPNAFPGVLSYINRRRNIEDGLFDFVVQQTYNFKRSFELALILYLSRLTAVDAVQEWRIVSLVDLAAELRLSGVYDVAEKTLQHRALSPAPSTLDIAALNALRKLSEVTATVGNPAYVKRLTEILLHNEALHDGTQIELQRSVVTSFLNMIASQAARGDVASVVLHYADLLERLSSRLHAIEDPVAIARRAMDAAGVPTHLADFSDQKLDAGQRRLIGKLFPDLSSSRQPPIPDPGAELKQAHALMATAA